MMTLPEFHNALRILRCIDHDELIAAGVIAPISATQPPGKWEAFSKDPYAFFIRCDDATCDKLWALIVSRMRPAFGRDLTFSR